MAVPVYSPGQRQKKKAMQTRLVMVYRNWSSLEARDKIESTMQMGKGFTLVFGASVFEKPRDWRCNLKSIFPVVSLRGSGAPMMDYFWPTEQSASETVSDLTGLPRGAMDPLWYR